MDNQTKVIFVLLAIIIILVGIFSLKITGIIKPQNRNIEEQKIETTEPTEPTETMETTESTESTDSDIEKMMLKLQTRVLRTILFIKIVTIGFWIFSNIGIAKLYKKIGMPTGYVIYQYFIMVIIMLLVIFNVNNMILNIILGIISLFVLAKYFEAVGMSKIWPVILAISIIAMFYVFIKVIPFIMLEIKIPMNFIIIGILGIIGLITYFVMYEISNYRLAKMFNKGTVFTVLLLVFPFALRPILGCLRD